ncbi:transposable element Tc1 transposase [Trichonephila clavipes]|uniref:Transposable element Tc1 transposase n=1 Tax=Trichonephila clavipes TaxID=2585209 RepID=A0A8X6SG11_TRICX|nr:transposable element Tc1 transposase [Trichonephila clavipes]
MSGDCRNLLRHGRSTKLRYKDRRVLSKEIRKNPTKRMPHIIQEFQKAPGTVVSINNICKEAHLLGSHGRAASHKSLLTNYNRVAQLM